MSRGRFSKSTSSLPGLTDVQEKRFGHLLTIIRSGNFIEFARSRQVMENRGEILEVEDLTFLQDYTSKFLKIYQREIKNKDIYDGALQIKKSLEERLQIAKEESERPTSEVAIGVAFPAIGTRFLTRQRGVAPEIRRRFSSNPRPTDGSTFLRRMSQPSGQLGAERLFEEFRGNIISGNLPGILENKDMRGIIVAISKGRDAGLSSEMIKELRNVSEENYKPLSLDASDSRFLILEMLNGVISKEISHFFEKPRPEMVAQTPRGGVTPRNGDTPIGSNVYGVISRRVASADVRLPSL